MLITCLIIFGIVVLIAGHEAGHFLAAKWLKMKVEEFGIGFPPRILARQKGETVYSLNWLPLGGFVKIAGENSDPEVLSRLSPEEKSHLFSFQPAGRRAIVIAAGVLVNFILGWLLLALVFSIGTPRQILIAGIEPASPAAVAELRPGTLITAYGTEDVLIKTNTLEAPVTDFIAFVNSHRGQELQLTIFGETGERAVSLTPRLETEENQGALGVQLNDVGIARQPILEALWNSLTESLLVVQLTFRGLWELVVSLFVRVSVPEGVVGPVGIFSVAHTAGSVSLIHLLQLMSLISLNLAVLNLIPFPALDGGHLLFLLIEKIKGSPLKHQTRMVANAAGMGLLLLLVLLITIRDVNQLFFS